MGRAEVKYLLDTGVWLRAVNESQTIPTAALRMLTAAHEIYGLASISLWEVGKKVQIGKLDLPKDLPGWFADALAPNIEILPLTAQVVSDAMRLPEFPNRDPADELIVATARVHKLTLLTTDTKLKAYRHAHIHYFTPIVRAKRR
jgi:PIN domain nuclease of toxin-antitoxin system